MTTTRRTLFTSGGWLGLWPFSAFTKPAPRDIYAELGIKPVVNLRGTMTDIGASKVMPEIHEAMAQAARQYVVLDELHDAIGARLAKLIGTEDAMVTTGTAGAMAVGACACLTGGDAAKVRQLPDLTGMKTEAVVQKVHRTGYDHAIRGAGLKMVDVADAGEMRAALGPRTAMLFFLGGSTGDWAWDTPVKLDECLKLAHAAGVPVMVDAANMLPPFDNLRQLAAAGVDLICVSGGKHMRGPQCSGILAGRRDLVRAARLNSNPHSDSHGRPMKVGREEMVGIWLAAERYAKLDFAALDRAAHEQAEYLRKELLKIPGVAVEYAPHDRTRRVQRLVVKWDEAAKGLTVRDVERQLIEGEPRIAATRQGPSLMFTLFMNDAGDEKVAARRMREIFGKRS